MQKQKQNIINFVVFIFFQLMLTFLQWQDCKTQTIKTKNCHLQGKNIKIVAATVLERKIPKASKFLHIQR